MLRKLTYGTFGAGVGIAYGVLASSLWHPPPLITLLFVAGSAILVAFWAQAIATDHVEYPSAFQKVIMVGLALPMFLTAMSVLILIIPFFLLFLVVGYLCWLGQEWQLRRRIKDQGRYLPWNSLITRL